MPPFKQFRYPMVIREHHLDSFHHVNNATYLTLLEEARWELLTQNGFGLETILENGVGPIVLECQIKFLKELRLRQAIVIESQLVSYEKKIGIMKQEIVDSEGLRYSEALLTFGVFDLTTRKLIIPTMAWLQAVGIETPQVD